MQIPIRAGVECLDGPCGLSSYVIVDAFTLEVTHLVLRETGRDTCECLIPIDKVAGVSDSQVQLLCSRQELEGMAPFVESEYVSVDLPFQTYKAGEYWMSPARPQKDGGAFVEALSH